MVKTVNLKITGKVQNVFFRVNTQKKAVELDLTGWVKNDADGTVRVKAVGEKEKLQKLIKWCQEGPECARVDDVEIGWRSDTEKFNEFVINH